METIAPSIESAVYRTWVQTWEASSRRLLDDIGVGRGWICADIGCGGQGILDLLHERTGREGCVIGVEQNEDAAARAEQFCRGRELYSVRVMNDDLTYLSLPRDVFDFVHARFLLPALLRPERAVSTMIDLARPGGIVALQEIDHTTWSITPQPAAWPRLRALLEATHGLRSDPNIGCRLDSMLRCAGLEEVTVRPVVQRLCNRHPFMRVSVRGMDDMRSRALHAGLAGAAEIDGLLAEVDAWLESPQTEMITFTVVQAWGRKPFADVRRAPGARMVRLSDAHRLQG